MISISIQKKRYFLISLFFLLICASCGRKAESGKTEPAAYFPESSIAAAATTRSLPARNAGNARPEIFVQMGHVYDGYTAVTVADFTPDGRHILSGSKDGAVKLWETDTGREIKTFKCQDDVRYLAISKDGRYLASGDRFHGNNIHVWDIASGEKIRSFSLEAPNGAPVAFCSDDRRLLAGGRKGALKLWDLASGKTVREYKAPIPGEVDTIVVTPDGKKAIVGYGYQGENTGQARHTIYIWEIDTGQELLSFNDRTNDTVALAITPDGKTLLSGDWGQNNVQAWDPHTGAAGKSFPTGGSSAIAVSAQGRYGLFGGPGNFLLVELSSGKEIRKIDTRTTDIFRGWVRSIKFSPDGRYALVGDELPQPTLWDLASGKRVRILGGYAGQTLTAQITENGRGLMTAYGYSKSMALWDYQNGLLRKTIHNDPKCLTTSAAISRDGTRAAFGGWDGKTYVSVWDVASAKELFRLHPDIGHGAHPQSLIFSEDGRRLIWILDSDIYISDTADGSEIRKISPSRYSLIKVAIDPTGGNLLLVALSNGETALMDLSTEKTLKAFKYSVCAFSADGKKIYSLTDFSEKKAVLKETSLSSLKEKVLFKIGFDSMVPLDNLKMANYIEKIVPGPDKDRLFFFDSHKDWIYQIDIKAGKITNRFRDHTDAVANIDITPDGQFLCSGSHDGTTRLWNPATGREVARFIRFSDGEWIVITPEGYYNASANGDRYLNVRMGNDVYGIENYRETFFRPDLVKVALAGGTLREFKTLAEVKMPPTVEIIRTPQKIDQDSVPVALRLTDNGGGIGTIRLYLNGSAVATDSRGIDVAAGKTTAVERRYTVKLVNGRNLIEAVAFNGDNTMQSNPAKYAVMATHGAVKPSLSALVIGINEFKNPKLRLNYPVADAELFASTLAQVSKGLFQQVDIRKLTTPEATTNAAIIREISSFKTLRPDDLFVFYIASHGTVDEGEYFLITSNVGSLRTSKLKADSISQNMLKEAIANIPATKKLIIIDTCNAGALGEAIQRAILTRGMSEDTALKILSRAVGSTILSASTSLQEALEGYQGHGLFTYVVAEGLKGGADKGKTGYIKTTELADYVDDQVPQLAEKVFQRAQYPTISISGQAFPIGKVR